MRADTPENQAEVLFRVLLDRQPAQQHEAAPVLELPADFLDYWVQRRHLEMLALHPVQADPSRFDAPQGSSDVAQLRCAELDRVIRRRAEIGDRPGARVPDRRGKHRGRRRVAVLRCARLKICLFRPPAISRNLYGRNRSRQPGLAVRVRATAKSATARECGTRLSLCLYLQCAHPETTAQLDAKETTSMTIDVATGISRILKQEGVGWVSTFPVCRVNNALGREGVPMLMMRDDRYAVAVADAFSRITAGSKIGVCTFQGGVNAAGMQYAYAGMAQAYEDGSPVLCITDGLPAGSSGNR